MQPETSPIKMIFSPTFQVSRAAHTRRPILWVSCAEKLGAPYHEPSALFMSPRLAFADLNRRDRVLLTPSSRLPIQAIREFAEDRSMSPVIWAMPQIDYDDALGIVVAGNIFGELALYDFVSSTPYVILSNHVVSMAQPGQSALCIATVCKFFDAIPV